MDGVFASEALDSSAESICIKTMDLSTFTDAKTGVLNYEHQGPEKGGQGQEIVGKILTAKKIFSAKDCENERERMYWNRVKSPMVYGTCRLYDAAGHAGAKALAAMIRDHVANDEPILVRFSIEGHTIGREGNKLTETIAKRVAMTLTPCNRTCDSGLLQDNDPARPAGFKKDHAPSDILSTIKVEKGEHQHPMFQKLGGEVSMEINPILTSVAKSEPDIKALIKAKIKAHVLAKTLTAGGGYGGAAPGTLTQGAALAREDLGVRKQKLFNVAKAAIRDYKPTVHGDLRKYLQEQLPEASDEFIDYFTDKVDQVKASLRKSIDPLVKAEALGIELRKALGDLASGATLNPTGPKPVDAHAHAHPQFPMDEGQKKFVHGLHPDKGTTTPSHASVKSFDGRDDRWHPTADGKLAFVKRGSSKPWNEAHREGAYYHAARDFFGLGHYVPSTVVVNHPMTGTPMSAQAMVTGAEHVPGTEIDYNTGRSRIDGSKMEAHHKDLFQHLGNSGELDKLAIMDHALGNADRHGMNYVVSKHTKPGLQLIDHGESLQPAKDLALDSKPSYLDHYGAANGHDAHQSPVHPEAAKWALALNPQQLQAHLHQMGAPAEVSAAAAARLSTVQQRLQANPNQPRQTAFLNDFNNLGRVGQ